MFLGSSAKPLFIILIAHHLLCLKYGPRFMQNRKPFQLKGIIIVFNLMQIMINALLLIELYRFGLKKLIRKCLHTEEYSTYEDQFKVC